jgi:hypothetical protein
MVCEVDLRPPPPFRLIGLMVWGASPGVFRFSALVCNPSTALCHPIYITSTVGDWKGGNGEEEMN